MTEFEAIYVGAGAPAADTGAMLRLRIAAAQKPELLTDFAGGTAELWDAQRSDRVVAAVEPDSDITIRIVMPGGAILRAFGPRVGGPEAITGSGTAVPASLAEGSRLQVFRNMQRDEYELRGILSPAEV